MTSRKMYGEFIYLNFSKYIIFTYIRRIQLQRVKIYKILQVQLKVIYFKEINSCVLSFNKLHKKCSELYFIKLMLIHLCKNGNSIQWIICYLQNMIRHSYSENEIVIDLNSNLNSLL